MIKYDPFFIREKRVIYKNLKVFSLFKITDFCIAYECNTDRSDEYENPIHEWKPIAKGCVCAEEALWNNAMSELELIDSRFDYHKITKGKGQKDKNESIASMATRLHHLNWYVF